MNVLADLRRWKKRTYLAVVAAGLCWLSLSGVLTDIVHAQPFGHLTPVAWWAYPFWITSAALGGLLGATHLSGAAADGGAKLFGGGLLSVSVVECQVWSKLVGGAGARYGRGFHLLRSRPAGPGAPLGRTVVPGSDGGRLR